MASDGPLPPAGYPCASAFHLCVQRGSGEIGKILVAALDKSCVYPIFLLPGGRGRAAGVPAFGHSATIPQQAPVV